MNFIIITPSLNQVSFLKRCINSVRDQIHPSSDKMKVYHYIQDGYSSDGTIEALKIRSDKREENEELTKNYSFAYRVEADHGMYDAINKGVENALQLIALSTSATESTSDLNRETFFSWLNCDEQYLPGTLEYVANYFKENPSVDILFGDYLLMDQKGDLIAYRKGYPVRRAYIEASHLYTLSCTMFCRMKVFHALHGFDDTYKMVGDEDFVVRALQAGFKAKHVRRYFSVFTHTGVNLGGGKRAEYEFKQRKKMNSYWVKMFRFPINLIRCTEKIFSGAYLQTFPLEYAVYIEEGVLREKKVARQASWKWPTRVR